MIIDDPCGWVIERVHTRRPFFTVRINDGDMVQMYRVKPEGALLGTDANPAYTHYALGDAYLKMLAEMAEEHGRGDDILIGCSWNTPRADEMGRTSFKRDVYRLGLQKANWCSEHWPLDGVVDGSTIRMLDAIRSTKAAVLVTCKALLDASYCLNSRVVEAPREDSWTAAEQVYSDCKELALRAAMFVWCGGTGLKPTAWRLWQDYPFSSHVDAGHLFNGAFGFRDYGWLQRGDGPWHKPYFDSFAPYVRRFLP